MRPRVSALSLAAALVVAVTSCTGETDYDVLDDYNATSSDPTVASKSGAKATADAGPHATTSRGTDAGTVAHPPDAASPSPAAPATDPSPAPAPPPKKKKGKDHDD